MSKAPEEGRVWEWRAFGRIGGALAAQVRAYPIRQGIDNVPGEDLYLVSPISDQNVKLRGSEDDWLLKFKLLIETQPGPFELYEESSALTYRFPLHQNLLREAARLLNVTLADAELSRERVSESEFVRALGSATPEVTATRVLKRRSQHQFDGGWFELAKVVFSKHECQSVSINSLELNTLKQTVSRLKLSGDLEPMNYVAACRRWGGNGLKSVSK